MSDSFWRSMCAFAFGSAVEEIVSYYHWWGDPHHPAVVIVSWLLTFAVFGLLAVAFRRLGRPKRAARR